MLSLTKGREIATFTKGKNFKGKKIYLPGEHEFKHNQKSENVVANNKRFELLKDEFFKKHKIKKKEKLELKKLLDEDVKINTIENEKLQDLYELVLKEIDNRLKYELDFSDLKGVEVFPIPQKFSERIFVPAPSGSGKSTFIGQYLKQLRILYPKI